MPYATAPKEPPQRGSHREVASAISFLYPKGGEPDGKI